MSVPIRNLANTFAVIDPDLRVHPVDVSPTLYESLDSNFAGFVGHVLMSMHGFSTDWPSWDRHPAGDEIVMLLSGSAHLVLRTDAGDREIEISEPGACVVIPQHTWHTARIAAPTRMLFITPGEGTENAEEPVS